MTIKFHPHSRKVDIKATVESLLVPLVFSSAICITTVSAKAQDGTWNVDSGSWGEEENWLDHAVPGGAGSTIDLVRPSGASRTITLDGDRIVGILNMDTSFNAVTLSAGTEGSRLIFDNGANDAEWNPSGPSAGRRTISAAVTLNSSLSITSSGGSNPNSRREISGNITAGGADEAKTITYQTGGEGELVFSGVISDGDGNRAVSIHHNAEDAVLILTGTNGGGNSTFSGGVRVSAGTLSLSLNSINSSVLGTGTLTLDGGALEAFHFSSLNFGNAVIISDDTNIRVARSNGGLSTTYTFGSLSVGNHTVTVHNTASASTSLQDTLAFGATTLTGNATFSVESVANTPTRLRLGALNGAHNLTKTGNGNLELLEAAGSYSGTTILEEGTLIAGHNTALGTGDVVLEGTAASVLQINSGVKLANDIRFSSTNAASAVALSFSNNAALNVGTDGDFRSDFEDGISTTASIRAGTANGATTAMMAFSPSASAGNDSARISDVFSLSLSSETTYVLQLSVGVTGADGLYLGWLNGGEWQLATDGNTGQGDLAAEYAETTWEAFLATHGGAFNAETMLGAYGYDSATGTVWSVLNHNSDFAVAAIPEPSTYGLIGTGLGLMLLGGRRRRRVARSSHS